MKTVKDIKTFIDSKQSDLQNTYHIGTDYSFQVYRGVPRQAAMFFKDNPILKIEERNEKGLSFFLAEEDNKKAINYSKGCYINNDESIVNIFLTFENHKNIEEVLAYLLLLNL